MDSRSCNIRRDGKNLHNFEKPIGWYESFGMGYDSSSGRVFFVQNGEMFNRPRDKDRLKREAQVEMLR